MDDDLGGSYSSSSRRTYDGVHRVISKVLPDSYRGVLASICEGAVEVTRGVGPIRFTVTHDVERFHVDKLGIQRLFGHV